MEIIKKSKSLKNSILDVKKESKIKNIDQHANIISIEEEKTLILPLIDQLGLFNIKATSEENKKGILKRKVKIKINKFVQECGIIIRPITIDGKARFFNKRDETIFDIIRYYSFSEKTSDLKNNLIGSNFSVNQIQKYLKKINKTMSKKQINESLDALKSNLIELHTQISITNFNLLSHFTVMNDGKLYASLSHIIQSDIEKNEIRFCFMQEELLSIKSPEAKCIALQMLLFFKQAGYGEYNLTLSSIYESIHKPLRLDGKNRLLFVKEKIKELIDLGFIKGYRFKAVKDDTDKRKINDYVFYFKASNNLISSTKKSNYFLKEFSKKNKNEDEIEKIDIKIIDEKENTEKASVKKEEQKISIIERIKDYWSPSEDSIDFLIDLGIPEDFIYKSTKKVQMYFYENKKTRAKPKESRYRSWIEEDWEKQQSGYYKNKSKPRTLEEELNDFDW